MTEPVPCARGCKVPGAHAIQHPAGSSCPGCMPRVAMRGTTVCKHCAEVFHAALRDLRIIWPDLRVGVARRGKTSTAGAQTVQTSGHGDAGDLWRPHVTRSITDISEWLEFVATALADTPVKGLRGIDLAALRSDVALAALAVNATPILIQHPALAEALVGEACRLRDRAHQALSTRFVRRIPLTHQAAKCICDREMPDPDSPDGYRTERCNGDLVAILQLEDSGRQSAIVCSRYPIEHRIPTTSWAALADAIAAVLP